MPTEIHWLAIIVAAVAAFMVGGLWYSLLFGKAWMAARGVTKESVRAAGANQPLMFGVTLLLELVMAFLLDHLLGAFSHGSLRSVGMISGGIALGFVIPALGVNYLYHQTTFRHFLIDAGHWLAVFLAMGAVLYLMG